MSVDHRPGAAAVSTTPSSPPGTWVALRPLVLRVHFWAGLLVGPFLLVAALSGFLYTLTPSMEQIVYRDVLHVPAGSSELPLSAQVRLGEAAVPGAALSAVRPGPTSTDTTLVMFTTPQMPNASWNRTAFVDPHTGVVRGVYDTYGSAAALPLRTWVDQLHDNLHLGDPGRLYSELAASWLWVLVLGGLVMWVGARRRARSALVPRARGPRRARLLSWHGAVGVWAAVGLLFLSATGLTWSVYAGANVTAVRAALSVDRPSPSTALPGAPGMPTGGEHAEHTAVAAAAHPTSPATLAGLDRAADAAARAGLGGPIEVTPPTMDGAAAGVAGIGRFVSDPLDAISVDPGTGAITDTVRFADWPLLAKLAQWGIDAHMGLLFGLANQVVLGLLALGLACMIVWGHVMWWRRGPGRRGGAVPPRGTVRALPVRLRVAVVVVTLAVAIALPVLGVSLAVFLVLDLAIGGAQPAGRRGAAAWGTSM